jgi:hypothetical protein
MSRTVEGAGFPLVKIPTAVAILALCAWTGTLAQMAQRTEQEQNAYRKAMEEADQKIAAAEAQHSEVMANEEYLTTFIGPRLTGSPGMQKASEWTLSMFQKYGVDAHLETAEIAHAWTHGNDWGELLTPVEHWMTVRSAAWSKATNGPIAGPLAIVDATTPPEDIAASASKFKNAIVLSGEEVGGPLLPENPPNAYNAVVPESRGVPTGQAQGFRERFARLRQVADALTKAGAAAMLRDSRKPDAMLLTGSASFPSYEPSPCPSPTSHIPTINGCCASRMRARALFESTWTARSAMGRATRRSPSRRSRAASILMSK